MVVVSVIGGAAVILAGIVWFKRRAKKKQIQREGNAWVTSVSSFHKRASLNKKR